MASNAALLPSPPAGLGSSVAVTAASEADRIGWDAFVTGRPWSGYHDWRWRTIYERVFGHSCLYLVARSEPGGAIQGVLPLVQINSRFFGRTLTSLPFLNYGGVIADSQAAADALLTAAMDAGRTGRCRHVELRHIDRRFPQLPVKQHKVTMLLPLQQGMWERIDRKVRNQIRKAQKSELVADRGGAELVGEFYTVFTRNMRDLGTPVYSRRLFDEVLRSFPDRAAIHLVRLNGQPIAAGLTYRSADKPGDRIDVPWASSIREFNSLCPNHLLYWDIMETAVAGGCGVLDFGRSTPNEGTYKFKAQWGAQAVPLSWEYGLLAEETLPDQSPKNPKYRAMIAGWQRCPLWLANALGPLIVKQIP